VILGARDERPLVEGFASRQLRFEFVLDIRGVWWKE
jgi:hypothetical protein